MMQNSNPSRTINTGLIGYGFGGRTFHAPVIDRVEGLALRKVVQRHGYSALERYADVEIVRSVEELLADEELELVVVATPSTNHYEVVKACLEAGKHVVVEKPFTATSAEADALIELSEERGLLLSVFHNRRWDGDFLTLRGLLQQGTLGDIVDVEMHWHYFDPVPSHRGWREDDAPGTGIFYDLGSHFIDQALCLFGLPDEVEGDVRVRRPGGTAVDYYDVRLHYGTGLKVRVSSSKTVREPGPRYIVHGTRGSFVKHGLDPQEPALIKGLQPGDAGYGVEAEALWGRLSCVKDGLQFSGHVATLPGDYPAYYRNVHAALTAGAELAVTAREARDVVRVIEAAMRSSAGGGGRVPLAPAGAKLGAGEEVSSQK
ncbi:Gfo/Idh/MocA family oxidoreductase [Paenibacillus gansuensis]|uniref:Gfo/Idh/MocA family oxidoreductase n=1 Tax=Paenibacillus gansuensis TaxID=306542 RepID=A0ABW5PJM6_9BACL